MQRRCRQPAPDSRSPGHRVDRAPYCLVAGQRGACRLLSGAHPGPDTGYRGRGQDRDRDQTVAVLRRDLSARHVLRWHQRSRWLERPPQRHEGSVEMTAWVGVGILRTVHITAGDTHVEVSSSQTVPERSADVPSAGMSVQRASELRTALGGCLAVQRSQPGSGGSGAPTVVGASCPDRRRLRSASGRGWKPQPP
jgi:hypothetical protein